MEIEYKEKSSRAANKKYGRKQIGKLVQGLWISYQKPERQKYIKTISLKSRKKGNANLESHIEQKHPSGTKEKKIFSMKGNQEVSFLSELSCKKVFQAERK